MSSDFVGAEDRIWDIVDRGIVSALYPICHLLSPAAEAALADRVREVGDYPDFSVRYGKTIAQKSSCVIWQ